MSGKDHLADLVRIPTDQLDADYPGLRQIVRHADAVVTGKFAGLRHDLASIKPPIAILEEEKLRVLCNLAFASGPGEMRDRVPPAFLEVTDGIIYLVSEEAKRNLGRGKRGRDYLTVMVAEEYVHAYTVVVKDGSARLGFGRMGRSTRQHNLVPNEFYGGDLHQLALTSDFVSLYVPRRRFRLTECLTRIAVNLMLPELLPDIGNKYPFLYVVSGETKKETKIIRKPKKMLDVQEILRSLLDGDNGRLRQFFTDKELEIMRAKDSHVFSLDERERLQQGGVQKVAEVLTFSDSQD